MTAWWIRVFSSAYGSTDRERAGHARAARTERWRCHRRRRTTRSGRRLRRSWSPMPSRPREWSEEAALLRPSGFATTAFASRAIALAKSESSSCRTTGLPLLTASGTARSDGTSMPDLHAERVLDLARLHADLRVRAVEDDRGCARAGTRAARASAAQSARSSASARRARRAAAARPCGRASPASARGRTATCRRRSRRTTRARPRAAGRASPR